MKTDENGNSEAALLDVDSYRMLNAKNASVAFAAQNMPRLAQPRHNL